MMASAFKAEFVDRRVPAPSAHIRSRSGTPIRSCQVDPRRPVCMSQDYLDEADGDGESALGRGAVELFSNKPGIVVQLEALCLRPADQGHPNNRPRPQSLLSAPRWRRGGSDSALVDRLSVVGTQV